MGDEWFGGGVVPPPYLFSVEITRLELSIL